MWYYEGWLFAQVVWAKSALPEKLDWIIVEYSDMPVEDFKRSLKDSGNNKLTVIGIALTSERLMYENLIDGYQRSMCLFAPRVVLERLDELQQLLTEEIERRETAKKRQASQRHIPAFASAH